MSVPSPRQPSSPPPSGDTTHPADPARYPIARPARLGLEIIAAHSGLHPDLVRRFVALSLVDASRDETGRLWFPPEAMVTLARIQRLRAGLGLNYAAIGLVLDLLERINQLETALRAGSERPWT